jgi:hypothetical protein
MHDISSRRGGSRPVGVKTGLSTVVGRNMEFAISEWPVCGDMGVQPGRPPPRWCLWWLGDVVAL